MPTEKLEMEESESKSEVLLSITTTEKKRTREEKTPDIGR